MLLSRTGAPDRRRVALDDAATAPMKPGLPDLHRHLDGSLRPATVEQLARRFGLPLPPRLQFSPGLGLSAALARFDFVLQLLQRPAELTRVAAEACEDAAADGVTTLELRFAPQLHRGAPLADIIDAVLDGLAGRAGLILCGLYGEDPALLHALVELAAARPRVVGIDLAGAPSPAHAWRLHDYAAPFQRAAARGLGRTVHAGEGRPPAEIRVAIERLGAQRIGHGTTLLDDPSLIDLVRARGVAIEACLTSNHQIGAITSVADHPLVRWLELGVAATICTDNTFFSAVTSSSEHHLAAALPGMTPAHLESTIQAGHAAAFRR